MIKAVPGVLAVLAGSALAQSTDPRREDFLDLIRANNCYANVLDLGEMQEKLGLSIDDVNPWLNDLEAQSQLVVQGMTITLSAELCADKAEG